VLIAVWIALPEILQSHDYAADLTAKDQALARAQDRARIAFDCRTANDPASMSSTIPAQI
jgi:hypothetical protein